MVASGRSSAATALWVSLTGQVESLGGLLTQHYCDVIMGAIASQITSLTIVYSTVYSDEDQRKHQSSASLAFVRGIHRGPVNSPTQMASNAEIVLMTSSWFKIWHSQMKSFRWNRRRVKEQVYKTYVITCNVKSSISSCHGYFRDAYCVIWRRWVLFQHTSAAVDRATTREVKTQLDP